MPHNSLRSPSTLMDRFGRSIRQPPRAAIIRLPQPVDRSWRSGPLPPLVSGRSCQSSQRFLRGQATAKGAQKTAQQPEHRRRGADAQRERENHQTEKTALERGIASVLELIR